MPFKTAIPLIIVVNILIFVVSNLDPGISNRMLTTLALYFPQHENFRYWQFITNMFMHGGFAHILFNMYALWAFGTPLEYLWRKERFLLFYFICGLGAGIIYTLINYAQFNYIWQEMVAAGIEPTQIRRLAETGQYHPAVFSGFTMDQLETLHMLFTTPVVGASGAIYDILVAFGILFPDAKLMLIFFPFPIAARYFVPILIGIDLFSGVTGFSIFGGGIAHFGHVGGALFGFLLMWYWRKRGLTRRGRSDHVPNIEE